MKASFLESDDTKLFSNISWSTTIMSLKSEWNLLFVTVQFSMHISNILWSGKHSIFIYDTFKFTIHFLEFNLHEKILMRKILKAMTQILGLWVCLSKKSQFLQKVTIQASPQISEVIIIFCSREIFVSNIRDREEETGDPLDTCRLLEIVLPTFRTGRPIWLVLCWLLDSAYRKLNIPENWNDLPI